LWSRTAYINTDGGSVIYNLGCQKGAQDKSTPGKQDSVVVLDFGSPATNNVEYGTSLFGIGFIRNSEIIPRALMYAQGYYVCSDSDRESHLTLAIGTTNYGTWLTSGNNAYNHGQAWASMVNEVNALFVLSGYAGQVTAVGASDIELTWNSPSVSINWVNGYDSANLYDMYDYGDLAGCPSRDRTTSTCWPPWTMDNVWYVAYGAAPNYPLPLIYANSGVNARQWSWLSKWALTNKGYRMDIVGSFTQCQACLQRSGDASCPDLDNKPAEGWQQLYSSLITDGVSQGLRWSTDIYWMGDASQPNPALCNGTSSPQAGGSLQEREAGLVTALQASDLNEDFRSSLEEKLATTRYMIAQQQNSPRAEKTAPLRLPSLEVPEFPSGIFEGDEGLFKPWQVQISNRWQGWDGDLKVQVLAGKQAAEAQGGVVFVWTSDAIDNWRSYEMPAGVGGVRILSVTGDRVSLQAEDGRTLVLDWKTGEVEGTAGQP